MTPGARSEFAVKRAETEFPVHPHIASRFSPYVFDADRSVEVEKIQSCLEAVRWAASSYNEQPWSFLLARREDGPEFRRMLDCLTEANQAWAQHAGVLLITVICPRFKMNDRENRVAEHDLGLAMGNFTLQASELGLHVHQMAGVDLDKARATYQIPATHQPMTAVALGYAAPPERASLEMLAQRDQAPRVRKRLRDFVYTGAWGQSSPIVQPRH